MEVNASRLWGQGLVENSQNFEAQVWSQTVSIVCGESLTFDYATIGSVVVRLYLWGGRGYCVNVTRELPGCHWGCGVI